MIEKAVRGKGFTLIEAVIVCGIIAVLVAVVFIVVHPIEALRQSRDGQRISDLCSLERAISFVQAQDPLMSLGSPNIVYVSVPDPSLTGNATSACSFLQLPELPFGQSYQCVSKENVRRSDGYGWLPIRFNEVGALNYLPVDPMNSSHTGNYYVYTSSQNGWHIASLLESEKYGTGGKNDRVSTDGGSLVNFYEKGTDVDLLPFAYIDENLSTGAEPAEFPAYEFLLNTNPDNGQIGGCVAVKQEGWGWGRMERKSFGLVKVLHVPSDAAIEYCTNFYFDIGLLSEDDREKMLAEDEEKEPVVAGKSIIKAKETDE